MMQHENVLIKLVGCLVDHIHEDYESANKLHFDIQTKNLSYTEFGLIMINLNSVFLVQKPK